MTDTLTLKDGTQLVQVSTVKSEDDTIKHPGNTLKEHDDTLWLPDRQVVVAHTYSTVAPPPPPPPPPANPSGVAPPGANDFPGYTLVRSDDFTENALDTSFWSGFYGGPNNFGQMAGSQGSVGGSICKMINSVVNGVRTGTGFKSLAGWTEGMVLQRVKCSGGAGVTMCLGVLGVKEWPPEIDYYEDNMGVETNTRTATTATIHYGTGNTNVWSTETGVDATQWHTWGVQWNSKTISYLVDLKGDGVLSTWKTQPNPDGGSTGADGLGLPQFAFQQIETKDNSTVESYTPAVEEMDIDWINIYSGAGV